MGEVEITEITEISKIEAAFVRFRNGLIAACQAEARLEYLDKGYISARKAWDTADQLEKEFKVLLNGR